MPFFPCCPTRACSLWCSWVDDHEVPWFLELLKNESEDVEEDEEEAQHQRVRTTQRRRPSKDFSSRHALDTCACSCAPSLNLRAAQEGV